MSGKLKDMEAEIIQLFAFYIGTISLGKRRNREVGPVLAIQPRPSIFKKEASLLLDVGCWKSKAGVLKHACQEDLEACYRVHRVG